MIDTNVFLDVLIKREPFYDASKSVLDLCEQKKVQGFLSASNVTDVFYIVHRCLHSTDMAYKALGFVLEIVKVLPVTNSDVLEAYIQNYLYWQTQDKKTLKRINLLIKDIDRRGCIGVPILGHAQRSAEKNIRIAAEGMYPAAGSEREVRTLDKRRKGQPCKMAARLKNFIVSCAN